MAPRRCADLPNISLWVGDAHQLRGESLSHDVVTCIQVPGYLAQPLTALRKIHRVLRPGWRKVQRIARYCQVFRHRNRRFRATESLNTT
ncbi:MAG: class I SAM-dependent methyltransferase [Proteobacteria bacterium]|nr:MAG: class I SAM-dependent methyltransferase [Pseudomonadota bacterium]QKK11736.1 MAG: class I SAM-dependent methyltransferase [Pseudomonadota bacterium]